MPPSRASASSTSTDTLCEFQTSVRSANVAKPRQSPVTSTLPSMAIVPSPDPLLDTSTSLSLSDQHLPRPKRQKLGHTPATVIMETLNLWLDNDMITTDQLMEGLLRRDPSLSDRLHEIQQWSSSNAENSNTRYVRNSADDPDRIEHISNMLAITMGSDNPGDTLMENVTLSDPTAGMVSDEGDCMINSEVGN